MNKKAFALIELIIVIATISILAVFAFVAIDPGKRIGEAQDDERLTEARSIQEAIEKYTVDNYTLPPSIVGLNNDIPYMITSAFISDSLYCSEIGENISEVVLGTILEDYLPILPIDPQEEDPDNNGTGYYLIKSYDAFIKVAPCNLYALSVPDPPTDLTYIYHGTYYIVFQWTHPIDDGGSIIIDYIIQYKEDIEDTWQTYDDEISTGNVGWFGGLTASSLYNFRVIAVNDIGNSYHSDIESWSTGGGCDCYTSECDIQQQDVNDQCYEICNSEEVYLGPACLP